MIILGLSVSHNSSAALYSTEEGLLAAISQERLNGQKNTKEIPLQAAVKCCEIANINTINKIAISHYEEITNNYFVRNGKNYHVTPSDNWENVIVRHLLLNNITVTTDSIIRVPHHIAHAHSTYAFYGKPNDKHFLITSDGFGDGESGTIVFDNQKYSSVPLRNSIGLLYQFVTGALGFKELQHEGKITGLAAFGKPIYMKEFKSLYETAAYGNHLEFKAKDYQLTQKELEMCKVSQITDFDDFLRLKKAVYGVVEKLKNKGAKREDIAATVQEFAEKYTINWIRERTRPGFDAYLAGGLFANVKINQRIKDMKDKNGHRWFNNVYVCPAMGDEGTAVGAALYLANKDTGKDVGHVICGTRPNISKIDINEELYSVKKIENTIEYISQKLAENKIVCLMRGKMEFGPRALCHRSILYNADSRETNDWLNKKLSRTEFMPFAPVTREEVADDLFINLDGGRDSAKFMTMTFDCTKEFAENYKAACHIDNTARPQIISKDDDPFMWEVLKRYQGLTGKKAMINTSFNLHNNPIIESVEVAIKSWLKSDTDVLVIEDMVIEKK